MRLAVLCLFLPAVFCPGLKAAGGTVLLLAPLGGSITNMPAGLTNVVSVAAGLDAAIALRDDGSVVAWGAGDFGVTNAPPEATNVVAVSSGWDFDAVLRRDGTIVTWGYPLTGAPTNLSNVVAIAAGGHQFCLALTADKTVVAWGYNGLGQTNVPPEATNVLAVAAGLDHNLALREDGTVVGWGDNTFGAAAVPDGLSNVVAIAAGWSQSYALRADGTVVAWGMDATNLPAALSNVVAVAGGWDAGREILFSDGTLQGYGNHFTNVMAVARGHFFTLMVRVPGGAELGNQVQLSTPSWHAGRFRGSLPTRNGRVYSMRYKNSLTDQNWTSLPLIPGNGNTRVLEDPTAAGEQRFYRVQRW